MTAQDESSLAATLAVLAHQIGELQHALDSGMAEMRRQIAHNRGEIDALKEANVRADERRKARAEFAEDAHQGVTVRLKRWHMWFVAAGTVVAALTLILLAAHIIT